MSDLKMVFGLRERYLMAQALVLGIEKLNESNEDYKEISNMQQMAALASHPVFAPFTVAILCENEYKVASNFVGWSPLNIMDNPDNTGEEK